MGIKFLVEILFFINFLCSKDGKWVAFAAEFICGTLGLAKRIMKIVVFLRDFPIWYEVNGLLQCEGFDFQCLNQSPD